MSEQTIEMGFTASPVETSIQTENNQLDLLSEEQKKHRESWDKVPEDPSVLDEELREYKEEVIGTSEEELGNTVSEEYLRELWNRRKREVDAETDEDNGPDYWGIRTSKGLKVELENGNTVFIPEDTLKSGLIIDCGRIVVDPNQKKSSRIALTPDSNQRRDVWVNIGFGSEGEEDMNGGLIFDGENQCVKVKIPVDDRFELFGQTLKLSKSAIKMILDNRRYVPVDIAVSIDEVHGK